MRYKEHTIRKIEGQVMKLESIQKGLEQSNITAEQVLEMVKNITKELKLTIERLDLEPNE